ncbi:MAG: hypothetical protein J5895_02870 [Alphaproteobacteria bacterium]|nr:hypothetical protein [Alphaproteobacteria bacterium]
MKKLIPWSLGILVFCAFAEMVCLITNARIMGGVLCIVCAIAVIPMIVELFRLRSGSMWVFITLAALFLFIAAALFGIIPVL